MFIACADKQARLWDLASNQMAVVGHHEAPIQSCHWIPSYNSLMTASWDKSLRFWDMVGILSLELHECPPFSVNFRHRTPWQTFSCRRRSTAPTSQIRWWVWALRIAT